MEAVRQEKIERLVGDVIQRQVEANDRLREEAEGALGRAEDTLSQINAAAKRLRRGIEAAEAGKSLDAERFASLVDKVFHDYFADLASINNNAAYLHTSRRDLITLYARRDAATKTMALVVEATKED